MGVGEPRTQWASRGSPYHPGDASGQLPPRGFRHCKWGRWGIKRMARAVGNTSHGTRPQRVGGPEGGEHVARAPDRRPWSGRDSSDPYNPRGASQQAPRWGFKGIERHR
ncbi:hypothetical protein COCNU_scaffold014595G000010 [Cocos nucifera]|nr:hypothetical protein [Cocos nucifera]